MENEIRIICIAPGRNPEPNLASPSLTKMLVGLTGIGIANVEDNMAIIYNKDAIEEGMPFNRELFGIKFFGPIILVGTDGDQFTDVPIKDLWDTVFFGGEL